MKRLVLLAAVAAFAGGCAEDGMQEMNHPFKKKPAAASSGKANYFEAKKNGKTYVLGSADSLKMLNNGQVPKVKEMPNFGPKGETVAIENTSYTEFNRLVAEYEKSHPK